MKGRKSDRTQKSVLILLSLMLIFSNFFSISAPLTVSAAETENTVYVSSDGDDESNDGSESSPYATISKAFSEVENEGTIELLSDVTIEKQQVLNTPQNKVATIQSKDGKTHSIIRGEEFIDLMFRVANRAHVTFKNLIIDGNDVEVKGGNNITGTGQDVQGLKPTVIFIGPNSKVSLEDMEVKNHKINVARLFFAMNNNAIFEIKDGTNISNNTLLGSNDTTPTAIMDAGGGGRIEYTGGEVSDNTVVDGSNGVMVAIGIRDNPSFLMTGGKITNNHMNGVATDTGNIAVFMRGNTATSRYEFGGQAYVYDNKNAVGEQRNVFLANTNWSDAYLALVSKLEDGAKIGVYAKIMPNGTNVGKTLVARTLQGTAGNPGPVFGTEHYTPAEADAAYFVSDKASSAVVKFDATADQIILEPLPPELDHIWLDKATIDGNQINLVFNDEVVLTNKNGFKVTVNGQELTINRAQVDDADKTKLTLTLAEAPTGEIVLTYTENDGTLKGLGQAGKKVEDFTQTFNFDNDLTITTPSNDPATVTEAKPTISGEVKENSTVEVVVKDSDDNVVTGAGGSATVTDGNWSFTTGEELDDGTYTFVVTSTSEDGKTIITKTKELIVQAGSTPPVANAPGGVSKGLALWMAPDKGMTANDGKVSEWKDQSSSGNDAKQETGNNQPTFSDSKESNTNFNPMVNFNGTNHYLSLEDVDKLPTGKEARTAFGVAKPDSLAQYRFFLSWGKRGSGAVGQHMGIGMFGNSDGYVHGNDGPNQGQGTDYKYSGVWEANRINDFSFTWTGDKAEGELDQPVGYSKSKQLDLVNNKEPIWNTANSTVGGKASIGSAADNTLFWSGDIGDLMVYNRALSELEHQKVSSYLAVKYGYTLDQTTPTSYLDSGGNVFWDGETNKEYNNRVTAIGKDETSDLVQKQAKSQEDNANVTIALGDMIAETNSVNGSTFDNDKSFFTFSDNGKDAKFVTDLQDKDDVDLMHIERVYKFEKTNNFSDTDLTFGIDKIEGAEDYPLYLVVSDDTTFTKEDKFFELDEEGLAKVNSSEIANSTYFTIAARVPVPEEVAELAQDANGKATITIPFDEKIMLTNGDGFTVKVGDTEITSATFAVDPDNPKNLIVTLPENTDVTDKEVTVGYKAEEGNLKGTNGVPVGDFEVPAKDAFTAALQITKPTGDPAKVATGKPEIKGKVEEGSEVSILIKDKEGNEITDLGGDATVDDDGNWTFTPDKDLVDGEYTIEVTATKGDKTATKTKDLVVDTNQYVDYEEKEKVEAIDPDSVTYDKDEGKFTVPNDVKEFTFKDGDKEMTATKDADGKWTFTAKEEPEAPRVEITKPADGNVTTSKPEVSGTATPGAKITVEISGYISDGVELTTTADENGNWSVTPTEDLADGPYAIKVTAEKDGKTSEEVKRNIIIDTNQYIDYEEKEKVEAIDPDSITYDKDEGKFTVPNDIKEFTFKDGDKEMTATKDTDGNWDIAETPKTPTVTVTKPTEEKVTTGKPEFTGTATPGATVQVKISDDVTLEVEADEEGNWSVAPKEPLADGDYEVEITAGKDGKTSKPVKKNISIDTNQYVDYEEKEKVEAIDPDSVTYDKDEGKFTVPNGVKEFTFKDGDKEMTATKDADGNWDIVEDVKEPSVDKSKLEKKRDDIVGEELDEEVYTPETWSALDEALKNADKALNNPDATQAEVDNALENLGKAREALTEKQATPPSVEVDEEEYDETPTFTGKSNAKEVTIELKDETGKVIETVTVPVNEDGTWSFTPTNPLLSGYYTLAVSATIDGQTVTDEVGVTIAAKPTATVTKPAENTVTTSKPEISGTATPGAKVTVKINDDITLETTADDKGNWSVTPTQDLPEGTNTIVVTAEKDGKTSNPAQKTIEIKTEKEPTEPEVDKTLLENFYNSVKDLDEEAYIPETWGDFATALNNAKNVLDDPNATQDDVDKALDNLIANHQKLVEADPTEEVDKTALQNMHDLLVGKGLNVDDYTSDSWNNYATALNNAKNVLDNPEATQAEVDQALTNLVKGHKGLKEQEAPVVDKSKLMKRNDNIRNENLAEDDYTANSWKNLETALNNAANVLADEDATQEEVDNALASLNKAYDGLVEKPVAPTVDKSKLDALNKDITGKGLSKDAYTSASWKIFSDAQAHALAVLADENATQAEVDAALAALDAAYRGLAEKKEEAPKVDKSKLEALNKKVTKEDLSKDAYTTDSWKTFSQAQKHAEKVLADENATQAEVNAALKALDEAYDGLVKKQAQKPTEKPTPTPEKPGTPNQPTSPETDGKVEEATGEKLPGTATPIYNQLALGFALLLIGLLSAVIFRRRMNN